MVLFCCLCLHDAREPRGDPMPAETIINGQAVCIGHSGYVQGAKFTDALGTLLEGY